MIDFAEKYNVFQSALEIHEPWYVFYYELAKEENIYIEYRSGAEFSVPIVASQDVKFMNWSC
ncbi:hypothetical protein BN1058_00693 [Paraliobacillus sp. PM-2]|nr:hypothetical protein BN1058_00693 [Paraliobacillus sp. PM-2]